MERAPASSFFLKMSLMMSEIYSPQLEEALSDKPKVGALAKITDAIDKYLRKDLAEVEERKSDKIQQFAANIRNAVCAIMTSDEFKVVVDAENAKNIDGVTDPGIQKKLLVHIVEEVVCAERRETLKEKVLDNLGFSSKIIIDARGFEAKQRLGFHGEQLVLDDVSQAKAKEYLDAFKGIDLSEIRSGAGVSAEENFSATLKEEVEIRRNMPSGPPKKSYEEGYDVASLEAREEAELSEAKSSYHADKVGKVSGFVVKDILAKGRNESKSFVARHDDREEFQKEEGDDISSGGR
jgi:hypothetical protein